uniref:Tensin-3 n=1 Tax=Sphaerodactylus townsendi TaxID=933632 RepID=A0ACB8FUT2_9SAUR
MPQFSGTSNIRPAGSYFTTLEPSATGQGGSLVSQYHPKGFPGDSSSSQESSSSGLQQESGASTSVRTFLNFCTSTASNGQPPGEKQVAFAANANGSAQTARSPGDSGFLPDNFLTSASGPSSQNSPNRQSNTTNAHSQPPLPEKKRGSEGERSFGSVSPSSSGFSSPHSGSTISIPFPNVLPDFSKALNASPSPENASDKHVTVKFVQDTSKFWYKPEISREQAIAVLKEKEPGSFVVRDSHSFKGAYGLAMKVAIPPPSVLQLNKKVGDLSNELVRHFLIECTHKGVRLKGCPNEPYFGSLTALVYQHSITPLALPCKLLIPDRDPLEEMSETSPQTAANSAADLLKQGAGSSIETFFLWIRSLPVVQLKKKTDETLKTRVEISYYLRGGFCHTVNCSHMSIIADHVVSGVSTVNSTCNVWYLNSVEMESLTGYQAVQKALSLTLVQEPPPISTVVHFKVSAQGITLTDNQRKLFFRRHYPVSAVIFCALDPQDRKWMKDGPAAKVFGFVARKQGSATDNVCHLFAEHDPEQPASAIVNFVSKVMIGSQKKN